MDETGDGLMRLAAVIGAVAWMVPLAVAFDETAGWDAPARVLVLSLLTIPLTLFVEAGYASLPGSYNGPLRLRRRGERNFTFAGQEEFWAHLPAARPGAAAPVTEPGRFGIDVKPSLAAAGAALLTAAAAFAYALDRAEVGDGFPPLLFVTLTAIPPAVYVLARSLLRIATARSALVLDGAVLDLGPAIAYVPTLSVGRASLTVVFQERWSTPRVRFVVDRATSHSVPAGQLTDPEGLQEWLARHWPEVPIVDLAPAAPPSEQPWSSVDSAAVT